MKALHGYRWCWTVLSVGLSYATPAAGETAPYSAYEQDVIAEALRQTSAAIDPAPEGKTVEQILIYRLKVFDHRDPVPKFVNVLHKTSQERVIRRELLQNVGERYDGERVAESARNLREIIQVSLVLILPIVGSTPDRVRLLVVTKDIWSLRAAWDPEITSHGFTRLAAAVDEINLAGLHKTVSLTGGFDPGSYWYGAAYTDPRVAGSRIGAMAAGSLVFDRATGAPEGSVGVLWYHQPLYSVATRWGWEVFVGWRDDVERSYVGTELRRYDATATVERDQLAYEWQRGLWYGTNAIVRSLGSANKLDVQVGFEALRGEYHLGSLEGSPAAVAEFRDTEVPPNHQRIGPFVGLRAWSNRFLRTLDVDTLALQEDIALGHDVGVRLYPASRACGSSRDLVGVVATGAYTVALGDGLARAVATSAIEFAGPRSDTLVSGQVHLVSPRLGFGRLVYDGAVAYRPADYYKQRFVLGLENRLRGYATGARRGRDYAASTLEFRSTSVGLLGVQLGGAVFYDVGDAGPRLADLTPQQSVGAGLRLLAPMFDRTVFRFDVGFPLGDQADQTWGFFIGFYQAIPLPRTHYGRVPAVLLE